MIQQLERIDDRNPDRIDYLPTEQIKLVLSRISNKRDKLLINLLYDLGCTLKELLNIRVRDLRLEDYTVSITGSQTTKRSARTCVFSGSSRELIIGQLKDMHLEDKKLAFLFTSSHGRALTSRRANQVITKTLTDLGFNDAASPQSIKYSHIINAHLNNVPIHLIRKQVGLTRQRIVAILAEIDTPDTKAYRSFFKNE